MTTQKTVHGHDLIHLIHAHDGQFSRAELSVLVDKTFGPDARFYTCSAMDMTFSQLLTFLLQAGKIVEIGGKLATDMSKVCKHD